MQFQEYKNMKVDGVIITKFDALEEEEKQTEMILNISHSIDIPISFIGNGERFQDFYEFNPDLIVNKIMNKKS